MLRIVSTALICSGAFALPSPGEIEKLLCEAASVELVEKEATAAICKLLKNKFPSEEECEKTIEGFWDELKEICPKALQSAKLPSPEQIKKLLCEAASSELFDKEATTKICDMLKKKLPSEQGCEEIFEGFFDEIKEICPKASQRAKLPSPEEIEKLVCEAASSELVEKEATAEICKLLKSRFPSEEECEKTIESYWDEIKQICPARAEVIVV